MSGTIERVVELVGHELRIAGDDNDDYVKHLPHHVREAALECAAVLLADDAVLLDVGANVGLLTIGFAFLAPRGRVVALEPSPRTFPHLVDNVASAGVRHVETLQTAASDAPGVLEFFDSGWFSAGSFVKHKSFVSELEMHRGSVSVPAEPIDTIVERLGLDRVDFVKVDVEGHELQALRGAQTTLQRFRPTAFVEMNLFATTCFGETLPFDFLGELCSAFPYVYEYALGDGLVELADEFTMFKRVQHQFLSGRPSDLICRYEPLPDDAQQELTRRALPEPAAAETDSDASDSDAEASARDAELVALRAEVTGLRDQLASALPGAPDRSRRFGNRLRRPAR